MDYSFPCYLQSVDKSAWSGRISGKAGFGEGVYHVFGTASCNNFGVKKAHAVSPSQEQKSPLNSSEVFTSGNWELPPTECGGFDHMSISLLFYLSLMLPAPLNHDSLPPLLSEVFLPPSGMQTQCFRAKWHFGPTQLSSRLHAVIAVRK